MAPKKVIIDCDAGTDDAQAIMMVLAYPELVELVAITSVFGNTSLYNVTTNIRRTLNLCEKPDIPVYAGCSTTMLGNPDEGGDFQGKDGFGDVPNLYPPGNVDVQSEHAVNALIRLAKQHTGDLTLIALGPLTNLATALKLDPDFGKNLKEVVVMGGNTTGQGNMTVCAEFNFYSDPEAAQFVLNHINSPLTLVHKEICEQNSFSWVWYDRLCAVPGKKAKFIKDIEALKVKKAKNSNSPKYECFDQLASAITIDTTVIKATQDVYATVELGGTHTRGMVIVDTRRMLNKPNNVKLLNDVDGTKYDAMMFAAVGKKD